MFSSVHLTERIENLEGCLDLKYLNVSNNKISKIDDLGTLRSLESLIMKQNNLSKPASIINVINAKRLRELDISKNKINCSLESILEVLSKCKSLKTLSLKGNPTAKSTKHYRKLVVSRCHGLIQLDGQPISNEERRRCNAWGKVVQRGGSFDEAEEADRKELLKVQMEKHETNALIRSCRRRESDVTVRSSSASNTMSASVIEAIRKTFCLIDSRASSSYISWSSGRTLDHKHHGDAEEEVKITIGKRRSIKNELEHARALVETQRQTIAALKSQLGEKRTKEVAALQQHIESSLHGMGASVNDSEIEDSYSFVKNEQLARKASLKEMQQSVADLQEGRKSEPPPATGSVGSRKDPFSVFPPVPPR